LNFEDRLRVYSKKAKVLTKFNPFQSRACPPRLEVNVYTGCAFQCKYCYARAYIRDFNRPRCKPDFKENLEEDVERALQLGLNKLPVGISNSCEPFQPLEDKYKHALFAIKLLTDNDFHLIIITKNPSKLTEPEYLDAMDPKRTFIEVTIPFLDSRFFEPYAPPTMERIKSITALNELDYTVAVRVDPIVPSYGSIPGQSPSEVETLIDQLHKAGVRFIIAKCLRLVGATTKAYPEFYHALRPYYQLNGKWTKNCYELKNEVKQELHKPVYQACVKRGILYSTCMDEVRLPGSAMCDQSNLFFYR